MSDEDEFIAPWSRLVLENLYGMFPTEAKLKYLIYLAAPLIEALVFTPSFHASYMHSINLLMSS